MASRIAEAAEKRALSVQYGSASYRFSSAQITDVVITPKGSTKASLKSKTVDVNLQGLSPKYLVVPAATIDVVGPVDGVLRALDPVRKAEEKLPLGERIPVDIQ